MTLCQRKMIKKGGDGTHTLTPLNISEAVMVTLLQTASQFTDDFFLHLFKFNNLLF